MKQGQSVFFSPKATKFEKRALSNLIHRNKQRLR